MTGADFGAARIAFLGTPDFAAQALAALITAGTPPIIVYSQPPRPAGRGMKPSPSAVEALATTHGIAVRTPVSIRDPAEIAGFQALDLDLAVVAAYGLILPAAVLAAPRRGCVNIHASLLPRWRGAAPIQRALLAGDTETGITLMQMDEGLDTGAELARVVLPVTATTTGGALHDALAAAGARLLVDHLAALLAGQITPKPQPAEGITYAAKIGRDDLRIDWMLEAPVIDRQIRAFAPRPGAWTELSGERVKILAATPVACGGEPGMTLDDRLTVACGAGALRLERIQRPGRGAMTSDEFLRGYPVPRGSRFAV